MNEQYENRNLSPVATDKNRTDSIFLRTFKKSSETSHFNRFDRQQVDE
jgi:hypothetical protein